MNIEDALEKLGVHSAPASHEHSRSGWINIDCPKCSPSKGFHHYRLGINKRGVYANCWSCGPVDIVQAIQWQTGKWYKEIKDVLKQVQRVRYEKDDKVTGTLKVPEGATDLQPAHNDYLKKRGFNNQQRKHLKLYWGVKGFGVHHRLSWRLFIPVFYKGELVSWTTRSISDKHDQRYISAAAIREEKLCHKDLLYGEDYVRDTIVVCEGPFDVWKIGPGAVATFGTSLKRTQINKIAKYQRRVICFDNEPSAQKAALELCDMLAVFKGETHNVVLSSKDPGSAPNSELRQLREKFLYRRM